VQDSSALARNGGNRILPSPPGAVLDKDQKLSVAQYDVKTATYRGQNLDHIKKVLFDKAEPAVYAKPRMRKQL
jgi:hypothetical protein